MCTYCTTETGISTKIETYLPKPNRNRTEFVVNSPTSLPTFSDRISFYYLWVKLLSNFDGNYTDIQQILDISTSQNFQNSDQNGEEFNLIT